MIYFFLTVLCFSIADSIWKIPLKYVETQVCIFYRNVGTTCLFGLAWIFLVDFTPSFSLKDIFYAIIVATIAYGGLYFFAQAQKYTKLTLIIPLLGFGSVIQFLIGIFYWGESAHWTKLLAFVIGLFAVLLMGFNPKEKFKLYDKGILYALLAATFWGISYSFFKKATTTLGAIPFGFILEAVAIILSILVHILQKKALNELIAKPKLFLALPFIAMIAVLGALGVYFTNMGYESLEVSSAVIIGCIGNLIPIAFGYFLYKERPSTIQFIGIGLALGAFALVQLELF